MSRSEPTSDELLRRAYALGGKRDIKALYRDWAGRYDRHLVDELHYSAPARTADLLAAATTRRDLPVLDAGCGTGLAGMALARHGFVVIDGTDISPEMLVEARLKDVYRSVLCADLTARLPFADRAYSAVIVAGVFTHGHVDAAALDELLRVLAPGGVLSCSVNCEVWEPMGFADALRRIERSGTAELVSASEQPLFVDRSDGLGRYCILRRV